MPNPDLLKYITDASAQGTSKEQIKQALLGVGWKEEDVEIALASIVSASVPTAQLATNPKGPTTTFGAMFPENPEFVEMGANRVTASASGGISISGQGGATPGAVVQATTPHHPMLVRFIVAGVAILLVAGGIGLWVVFKSQDAAMEKPTKETAKVETVPVVVKEKSVEVKDVKGETSVTAKQIDKSQSVTTAEVPEKSTSPVNSGNSLVKISGVVSDDPLSGATVIVKSASGTKLAAGTTDSQGRYSVMVPGQSIQSGYEITVTGGRVGTESFSGTLVALYSPSDNLSESNVTLITTLVSKLSESSSGKTRIEKRNVAVNRIASIGIVNREKWSDSEYSSVGNLRELRRSVRDEGVKGWLTTMVADLADDDLSAENMRPFPNAHGGIVSVGFGGWGIPEEFKGFDFNRKLSVIGPEGSTYTYKLIKGPSGLTVDTQGGVLYKISDTAPTGRISFQIKVSNSKGSRIFKGIIYVMDTKEVASGIVPVEGGTIADAWEDVTLTVPPGVLTTSTSMSILRGTQENGYYTFTFKSSPDITGPVYLKTPSSILRQMELEQQNKTP